MDTHAKLFHEEGVASGGAHRWGQYSSTTGASVGGRGSKECRFWWEVRWSGRAAES